MGDLSMGIFIACFGVSVISNTNNLDGPCFVTLRFTRVLGIVLQCAPLYP